MEELARDSPIDAVYQAWSLNGGKSWQTGKVTMDARIFELGRSERQQSFLARALTLNGKPFVEPVTPPACDCTR